MKAGVNRSTHKNLGTNSALRSATPVVSKSNAARPATPLSSPIKPSRHRKTKSLQSSENFPNKTDSPYKSRLDFSSIPSLSIDDKSCQAEILKYEADLKRDQFLEKKLMSEEWINVKKKFQSEVGKDLMEHEGEMTNLRTGFKRMAEENERIKKEVERQEKIQDFLEVREARRKIRMQEKEKAAKELESERIKAAERQREAEEKRERDRVEREEKRKYFMESVLANKKRIQEENLRIKKEHEFEAASQVFGMKEIAMNKSLLQKSKLDKVMALF